MTDPKGIRCIWSEAICAYAVDALPADEAAAAQCHIASCPSCQEEFETLRPVTDSFAAWPGDIVRPRALSRQELAKRIAGESGVPPVAATAIRWVEPEWKRVAPGIECKLLATDTQRDRISMLVRLAPGTSYPSHTHADEEQLYLLDGELRIDQLTLLPGDCYFASAGTSDARVFSETGCTCLLITSPSDTLN